MIFRADKTSEQILSIKIKLEKCSILLDQLRSLSSHFGSTHIPIYFFLILATEWLKDYVKY